MTPPIKSLYKHDLKLTINNKLRLKANQNLMFWYENLYKALFESDKKVSKLKILEIGSGASPLKQFVPNVITSDILDLDYLDIVFDCHMIANSNDIEDKSLDLITMTNVMHHLKDPIGFLKSASTKLAAGGQIRIVEPYFSVISYPIFKYFHHEPVNFNIEKPMLSNIRGPLSTSNQALPYIIFFSEKNWIIQLKDHYDLKLTKKSFFSSMSYFFSGGISRRFPIPHFLYRFFFGFDNFIARKFPKLFASFFCVQLVVKK